MGTTRSPFFRPPVPPESFSQQLDPGELGSISRAVPEFQDSGITPGPRRESRSDLLEKPVGSLAIADSPFDLAAGAEVAPACQRNEPLRERPQLLCLCDGGLDAIVCEERRGQVVQQRPAVRGGPAQGAPFDAVPQEALPG